MVISSIKLFNREKGLEATSQEILQKAVFANGPALPKPAPLLLSGHSIGSVFAVSNYTSLYRGVQDVVMSYPSVPLLQEIFSGTDVSLSYHAFGSATGINMIIGAVQAKQELDALALKDAIEDKRGSLMGRLAVLRSGAYFGAGLSFAVFRPLAMIDAIKSTAPSGFNAPSLLGRISYGFVFVGMLFFSFYFTLFSAIFGVRTYEGMKFKRKLKGAKDLASQVDLLQKKMKADPRLEKEITRIEKSLVFKNLVKKLGSEEAAKKELASEAIASGKGAFRDILKELGIKEVSEDKLQEIVQKVIDEEGLIRVGIEMREAKIEMRKENKMQRVLDGKGKKALEKLRLNPLLTEQIRAGDTEAIKAGEELIATISKSNQKNINQNVFLVSVLVMGIAAMILGLAFPTGPGLLVAASVMLVFSVIMTGVDGLELLASYRDEQPAKHDKKMLIFSSVLGLVSLISAVGLGVAGLMPIATFPMIVAIVLSVIWLGQNAVTWAIMNRNERRFHEKNPTIESLLKALENKDVKERIQKMIENLAESDKQAFEVELKKHEGDEKKAALSVIEKVKEEKKEHLEALRKVIMPLIVTEKPTRRQIQ